MSKEIIYIPNEVDKAIVNGLCSQIIELLEPLSIPQKAFALHSLLSSFEEVAGIEMTAIIDKDAFGSEDDR